MKSILRIATLIALAGLVTGDSGRLYAQSSISSVRVSTNPIGGRFMVDGVLYYGAQVFLWPTGSKHTIQFPQDTNSDGTPAGFQSSPDGLTHYGFTQWVLSTGTSPSQLPDLTLIADPTITSVTMALSVSYRVQLRFSSFPTAAPVPCVPGSTPQDAFRVGLVMLAGACFGSNADVFLSKGLVPVVAYPFPGYLFQGWATNGGPPISYAGQLNVPGPIELVAMFTQAKRVTFVTSPPGLNVLVDRTTTPTIPGYANAQVPGTCPANLSLPPLPPLTLPALCYGDFDFLPGSSHVIGAPTPQYDLSGNMWVIDSFSNGVAPNGTMVASTDLSKSDVITAKFVPGKQVAFLTSPSGLKLSIDGRTNYLTYNFAWGVGQTHTVSAPDQTDANGRRWVFAGWSNGGPATQNLTVTDTIRLTAIFKALPQAILQTNPPGMTLSVDGTTCTTPCVLDRPAGSSARVEIPASVSLTDSSRLQFDFWSDGVQGSRTVTFDSDQQILVANYVTQYKLLLGSDPSGGATFSFNPPSPDQYFNQGAGVVVSAQTKGGYKFKRWDGDLVGTYSQATVMMAGARAATAILDRVPYIAPAGIRSAAGATPDGTVAPGSLISITGESLTAAYVAGRTSPLAQGIGDITVTMPGGRLLPLVFISPQEVRALLFSDLADGTYSLTVNSSTQQPVTGQFTVSRNAPGLFPAPDQPPPPTTDTLPDVWALHEDGTSLNSNSPAIHGETITIYGTGFGPVSGFQLDGYPAASDLALKDALQVQAGDVTVSPVWAGAVGGQIGLMSVKVKITDDFPVATSVKLAITVNGKTSNPLNLALQ